jgi:hypothetical protein
MLDGDLFKRRLRRLRTDGATLFSTKTSGPPTPLNMARGETEDVFLGCFDGYGRDFSERSLSLFDGSLRHHKTSNRHAER